MLDTFNVIIQYFEDVYELQKQKKISPLICDQLFQGMTDYLES